MNKNTIKQEMTVEVNHTEPLQSGISELKAERDKYRDVLDNLKQFLYNEIIERRDYSASKSFEVVLEEISKAEQTLNSKDK